MARSHLQALGVTPPGHLLVVVQRTVTMEGRPLQALLQVFEDASGRTRHVLYIALTAGGRRSSDEDVVATLRQQLQHVVAAELGTARLVALEAPAAPPAAGSVDSRPEPSLLDDLMLPDRTTVGGALPLRGGDDDGDADLRHAGPSDEATGVLATLACWLPAAVRTSCGRAGTPNRRL